MIGRCVAMAWAVSIGLCGLARAADTPAVIPAPIAAPASPFDFAFGFKAMSDYNFRGISQSARGPSGSVYGEFRYDWLYAGAAYWYTRLPTQPIGEIDLYAGIRPQFGPVTLDIGVMYYLYARERQLIDPIFGFAIPRPGNPPFAYTTRDTDFIEFYAKPTWDVNSQVTLGANVFYTPNWLRSGSPATFASLTGRVKLPSDFAVSAEFGRYWFSTATNPGTYRLVDYNYWNAGVSWTYKDSVTIDLRYHGTSLTPGQCNINTFDPRGMSTGATPGRSSWCGHSLVATLSVDLLWSKLRN